MVRAALLLGSVLHFVGPEPGTDIVWDAPLACPGPDEFEALLAYYLGGDPHDALQERQLELRASAYPDATGFGWAVELQVESRSETVDLQPVRHEVQATDCRTLAAQAAALAATTIDPFSYLRTTGPLPAPPSPLPAILPRPQPARPTTPVVQYPRATSHRATRRPLPSDSPAPSPTPSPTPPSPTLASSSPSPTPSPAPPPPPLAPPIQLRGFVSASASLGLNLIGVATPGIHAQLGVERGLLRVSGHGGVELAGRFRSPTDPSVGASLRAWELGLRACAAPRFDRLGLRACAAGAGGQIRAEGVGVQQAKIARQPWAWLAPELGLAWHFSEDVAVFADIGLSVALRRPQFYVERPDTSFTLPLVAGRGRLGLELRFPRAR
ncbi:hypothetical protein DB30_04281 [Enhygromyxa salina]|uniref:Uncharacterized protein n=1 Tax=Enhygromyxa salina TaxID=215803 RepID=A0A0C2D9L1_9BACT|nr:hypothetical protein [Enhygromyxa salina]KIG16662.1 hypothetical protein DB30_04281 [Enhygromyxa salina]